MAISAGVGPHFAWLTVNGSSFPVLNGSATLTATKKSGTFAATIPLWMPGVEQTFAHLGDNQASVSVSTRGQQGTLMSGEIDTPEFDYIGGVLSITGRDASAKLHQHKSAEKWVNKQPSDIIQDLGGRVGLSPTVDPTTVKAGRIVQIDWSKLADSISYATAIHKLAEFTGCYWYVKDSKLVVKNTPPSGAPYVINFSSGPPIISDATSLKVRRNIPAGKPIKVTAKSWHPTKKKTFVGSYSVGGNGTTQEHVYHLPELTQDHVDRHAQSKAKDHARHAIEITAQCVGDVTITIDQPLQLRGTAFAGSYKLDSIEHRFGEEGHTMTLTAKSAGQGRSGGGAPTAGGRGSGSGPAGNVGNSGNLVELT